MRKDRCLSPTRPEIKEINNSISKELGLENQSIYTKDLVEKIQLFASLNLLDQQEAIKPKYRGQLLDYLRKAYKINTFYETPLYQDAQQFLDTIEGLGEPIEASKESVERIKQMLDEATENHATYFQLNDGSYIINIDKPVEKIYGVNNEQELQQIKAKAIADGTFMKAPNGNPTNLTERQWLQVRAKNFINWFGDWINDPVNASKVVDKNGEPLVVYHGSPKQFNVFDWHYIDEDNTESGFFFSSDKNYAKQFGTNIFEVFLNVKNPIISEDIPLHHSTIHSILRSKGKDSVEKYDGIIGGDLIVDNFNYSEGFEIMLYNPNQIKSATDNNGEFSDENNNIYYEQDSRPISNIIDKELQQLKPSKIRISEMFDKSKNVNKVLNLLRERGQYNAILDLIDNSKFRLKERLSDVEIQFDNVNQQSDKTLYVSYQGRRAYYDSTNKIIHIDINAPYVSGDASSVIMHEIMHAVTLDLLKSNPEQAAKLRKIMDEYSKKVDSARYSTGHGLEEFVADIWSNEKVIEQLKSTKSDDGKASLWDKILDFFNNLFSGRLFDNVENDSLMAQASQELMKLLDMNALERQFGYYFEGENIIDASTISDKTADFGVVLAKHSKRDEFIQEAYDWIIQNPSGLVAYRIGKYNTIKSVEDGIIGNPFNWQKVGTGVALQRFMDWLVTGNDFGESAATPEFRQAVINKILSSNEETPILYYKDLKGPSHATVIGYLIRNKNLLQNPSKQQPSKQSQEVVKDLNYYTKQLLQLREDFTKVVRKRKDFEESHVYEVFDGEKWRKADMSVTQLIEDKEYENASGQSRHTVFGNANDAFIRDYFSGGLKSFYSNIGDKNSKIYKQLKQFCDEFKTALDAKFKGLGRKYKVFTKFDSVNGNDEFTVCQKRMVNGEWKYVAGTIDMIIVDDVGDYYLYDMKTTGKNYSAWQHDSLPNYKKQVGYYRQMLQSESRIEIKDRNVGFLVTYVKWPRGNNYVIDNNGSIWHNGQELYDIPEFEVGRWEQLDQTGDFIVKAGKLMTGTPPTMVVQSMLLSQDEKEVLSDMPQGAVYKTQIESTVKQIDQKDIEREEQEEEQEEYDFDTSDLITETLNSETQPVSSKEQLFIGRTAVKTILDKIDEISENNSSLDDLEIEGIVPDITGLNSQQILRRHFDQLREPLYKWFRDNYLQVFEEDSDEIKYKKEFLSDERNFRAIMNSVQADFAEATGLPLKSNLRVLVENEENPDVDDMFEQDRLAEDGREPYSIDSKEKSYEKTMTQEVKKEFSRIVLYNYQKDEYGRYLLDEQGYPITEKVETINQYDEISTSDDYQEDPYGYGFPLYIDKHNAINFIAEKFHTCQDSEELLQAMKDEMRNTPWLSVIVRKMDDNPEFATQMFMSFNRNKSLYMEGRVAPEDKSFNKKIKAWQVDKWTLAPLNEKVKLDELRGGINEKFLGEQNISDAIKREGKNGKYHFVYDHKKALKDYKEIRDNYDSATTYDEKVGTLKEALALFGFDISKIEYPENLLDSSAETLLWGSNSRVGLFKQLMQALNNHASNVTYEVIAKEYSAIARIVAKGMADRYELSSYSGGKSYMTYTQISHIERMISQLSGENPLYTNEVLFDEDSIYTKYRSYYVGRDENNEMIFTNSVLQEIYDDWRENIESQEAGESFFEKRKYLKHYTLTAMDSKPFFKQSQADVWYSILTAYFSPMLDESNFYYEDGKDIGKDLALFRVGTMSDKPASEFIQWFKPARVAESGDKEEALSEFKETIADKAYMYFGYEIERMKAVLDQLKNASDTDIAAFNLDRSKAKAIIEKVKKGERLKSSDLVDPSTKRLYGFIQKSGLSFRFLPMFNQELEQNTAFGKTILSLLYDSDKLNLLSDNEKNRIYQQFKDLYIAGMDEKYAEFFTRMSEDLGVEESKLLKTIQKSIPVVTSNDDRLLQEFFYNDSLMTMNLYNLLMGDIAYKKDTIDLQKRSAEYHATTTKADIKAKMREGMSNNSGGLYSDGKFRAIIIEDQKDYNEGLAKEVKKVFEALAKKAKEAGDETKYNMYHAYSISIPSMIKDGIDVTDGQGFSSPTAFWKKMHMLGECPIEFDDALQDIKAGNVTLNNIGVVIQEFKPFVFTQIEKAGTKDFGKQIVPMQIKDSEAMVMLAGAIMIGAEKAGIIDNNPIVELFNLMEASAYGLTQEYLDGNFDISHCTMDKYTGKGIDTIVFKSAVKNGASGVLNLNGKNNEQIRTEVFNKVLDENGIYNPVYVQEFDFRDWGKQQNNPAHMQDEESGIGSQVRILSVSDLPEDFQLPKEMQGMRKWGIYKGLSDKQIYLKHYFELIDEDFRLGIEDVKQQLGLNGDEKVKDPVTGKYRWISSDEKLAQLVQDAIAKDTKYSYELYKAFTLKEEQKEGLPIKRFAYSIGDPSVSDKAFSVIFSLIKKRVNNEVLPGGPVVQVAPYGMSEELHLINNEGKTIDVGTLVKGGKITSGMTMEVYITAPTKEIQRAIMYNPRKMENKELSRKYVKGEILDIVDILKLGILTEKDLEMIGYRIPTEDKYSAYRMKIKGFLPREAGEQIIMPREITLLSGTDYDIDKMYCMFRYSTNTAMKAREKQKDARANRMTLKNEIFDMMWTALGDPSCIEKQLHPGSFKPLVDIAKELDDHYKEGNESLMYVQTQVKLHKDNAAGKEFVGIAALNNVSHSVTAFADVHFREPIGEGMVGFDFNFTIKDSKGHEITNTTFVDDAGKVRIDPEYSPVDGERLSRTIGMFVGASADNAKEAVLGSININPVTGTIAMGMMRIGFSPRTVAYMLSMPSAQEAMKMSQVYGIRFEKALASVYKEVVNNNGGAERASKILQESVIDEAEMLDVIKGRKSNDDLDLAVLTFLLEISPYCQAISDINSLTSLNSTKNAVGPTVYDTIAMEYKIKQFLQERDNSLFDTDILQLAEKVPFLKTLANVYTEVDGIPGLCEQACQFSPLYQTNFRGLLNKMSEKNVRIDADFIKKLYNAFCIFEMTRTREGQEYPIMEADLQSRIQRLYGFPVQFLKAKQGHLKDNLITQGMYVDSMNKKNRIQAVRLSEGLSRENRDDIAADWESILFSEEGKVFSSKLIEYMASRFGFSWMPRSAMSVTPNRAKMSISGYSRLFTQEDNWDPETLNNFIAQFALNNIKENSLWVKINKKEAKEEGKINKTKIDVITGLGKMEKKDAIEISSDIYKFNFAQYFGIIYDNSPYVFYEERGGDVILIKAKELGIPNNFLEYNADENATFMESAKDSELTEQQTQAIDDLSYDNSDLEDEEFPNDATGEIDEEELIENADWELFGDSQTEYNLLESLQDEYQKERSKKLKGALEELRQVGSVNKENLNTVKRCLSKIDKIIEEKINNEQRKTLHQRVLDLLEKLNIC